jgi:hypothetical protein
MRIRHSCNMESSMTNADVEDSSGMKILTGGFGYAPDLTNGDGANWDISVADFPDWRNLVDQFDMQGFEGVNYSI